MFNFEHHWQSKYFFTTIMANMALMINLKTFKSSKSRPWHFHKIIISSPSCNCMERNTSCLTSWSWDFLRLPLRLHPSASLFISVCTVQKLWHLSSSLWALSVLPDEAPPLCSILDQIRSGACHIGDLLSPRPDPDFWRNVTISFFFFFFSAVCANCLHTFSRKTLHHVAALSRKQPLMW